MAFDYLRFHNDTGRNYAEIRGKVYSLRTNRVTIPGPYVIDSVDYSTDVDNYDQYMATWRESVELRRQALELIDELSVPKLRKFLEQYGNE